MFVVSSRGRSLGFFPRRAAATAAASSVCSRRGRSLGVQHPLFSDGKLAARDGLLAPFSVILMLIKASPFLCVAHILVGAVVIEIWNSRHTYGSDRVATPSMRLPGVRHRRTRQHCFASSTLWRAW